MQKTENQRNEDINEGFNFSFMENSLWRFRHISFHLTFDKGSTLSKYSPRMVFEARGVVVDRTGRRRIWDQLHTWFMVFILTSAQICWPAAGSAVFFNPHFLLLLFLPVHPSAAGIIFHYRRLKGVELNFLIQAMGKYLRYLFSLRKGAMHQGANVYMTFMVGRWMVVWSRDTWHGFYIHTSLEISTPMLHGAEVRGARQYPKSP